MKTPKRKHAKIMFVTTKVASNVKIIPLDQNVFVELVINKMMMESNAKVYKKALTSKSFQKPLNIP